MRGAFNKGILRSITRSLGRFLAIAIIVALGTGFYAGLRMTAPDMKLAADTYYDGTNLADLRVMSTLGLTDDNVDELLSVEGVEGASGAYETDVLATIESTQYTIRIHSLDIEAAQTSDTSDGVNAVSEDTNYINRPILVEGEWPDEPGECVLSADAVNEGEIVLGDTVSVLEGTQDLDETLKYTEYTVVGFVRSSYYVSSSSMGTTSLGSGSINQYMYIAEDDFADDLPYTEVFLTVTGAKDLLYSSDEYDELVEQVAQRIEDLGTQMNASRLDEVKGEAQSELDEAQAEYESERAEAEEQLAEAKAELEDAKEQLDAILSVYGADAAEYKQGLAEYEEGLAEYEEQKTQAEEEFAAAEEDLVAAQEEIDSISDPEWYVLDRSKIMGVESFESDANRINQIAQVFPFIFFLVAALVSLTTMTRMVEEERVLIGTYKALGYSKVRITSRYLIYALVASALGSAVGIVILSLCLPSIIMEAYSIVYVVPVSTTPIDPGIALLAAGLGIGITLAATCFAATSTLREVPALLMLPRAPKAGKRILLERIRPLWWRMSFSWKVTARNIFRYKRRFFMAIVGIAGCTALLLTGLGLQNAINDIIDKQFSEIYHYNMTVRMDDDISDDNRDAVMDVMDDTSRIDDYALMATANMIARSAQDDSDSDDQRFELVVPQDTATLQDYVTVRERVGHTLINLDDEGVVISEKLATALGISEGDTICLYEEDTVGNASGEGYDVVVAGIMENYVSQYIFMTPGLYEQVFGEAPIYSTIYAQSTDDESLRVQMSDELLAIDDASTVGYNDETISTYRTMLQSVDAVVVVLIVAAALLAFVVLYNLTNINITERAREIATLKVLGFTPHEVDAYIYRETLLLSAIGALAGMALGIWMESFVVVTAEVDQVMFGREIHALSFAIAFALTMLFSVIVTIAMRRKLDRIDMVESLKSIE